MRLCRHTHGRHGFEAPVIPLEKFCPAEGYHQDYFAKNPGAGYCQFVSAPKIKKLEHALEAEKR